MIGGGLALIIGPFQFMPRLRDRNRRLHRRLGRVYLIAVALSSLAALVIALGVISGLSGAIGLSLLALTWFFTGLMAYRQIRAGDTGTP